MEANKLTKLMCFLSEALPYVDSLTPTEINKGGCGIFARDLAEEFDKLGVNYQIFGIMQGDKNNQLDEEDQEFIANDKKFLATGKKEGKLGFGHVLLYVEEMFAVDSNGIENFQFNSSVEKVPLTKEQLQSFIDKGSWCPIYDRSTESNTKKNLSEVFSKFDEFTPGTYKVKDRTIQYTDYTVHQIKRSNPLSSLLSFMP